MDLPALPELPSLSGVLAQTAAIPAVTESATPAKSFSLFGIDLSQLVAIALGLILITVGLLSFKQTQQYIGMAAKAAAV